MAVVHDQGRKAGFARGEGAGGAVAGDPDGLVLGQHDRLVAHLGGGVAGGIDPQRAGQGAAMAA